MRTRAHILAGAAFTAILAAGCQSLTVVDKTPDRKTVSAILVKALACRETTNPETGEIVKCDTALQPASVTISSLDCEALPLRSARNEEAHAACDWTGSLTRANGAVEPLSATGGVFSLLDLTPGSYRPTLEWSLDRVK